MEQVSNQAANMRAYLFCLSPSSTSMGALVDPKTFSKHTLGDGTKRFPNVSSAERSAEWLEIYDRTIDLAETLGATANIVMKTHNPFTYAEVEAVIGATDMHKTLWSPQSSKDITLWDTTVTPAVELTEAQAMHEVLTWIDDWTIGHEKDIAIWDSIVFSNRWWGGKSFQYNRVAEWPCLGPPNCKTYDNLLGYLKEVSGKRAGLWQIEPGGRRGLVHSFYEWLMRANDVTPGKEDYRGDFITNISYKWASHAGITTDRQDVYRDMRDNTAWFAT